MCKSICWLTDRPSVSHIQAAQFLSPIQVKKSASTHTYTRNAHISTHFFSFWFAFNYEISYEAKKKENRMRIRVNFGVELAFEVAFLAVVLHVTFFFFFFNTFIRKHYGQFDWAPRRTHYYQLLSRHMHTLFVLHRNSNVV